MQMLIWPLAYMLLAAIYYCWNWILSCVDLIHKCVVHLFHFCDMWCVILLFHCTSSSLLSLGWYLNLNWNCICFQSCVCLITFCWSMITSLECVLIISLQFHISSLFVLDFQLISIQYLDSLIQFMLLNLL